MHYRSLVRRTSLAFMTGVMVTALCGMCADVHAARSLRVRGVPRIDGHAGRSHGHLLVEGRVVDDANVPVPSAALAISLGARGGARTPAAASACQSDALLPAVKTDESGRFCVWVTAAIGAYDVQVDVGGSDLLSAATITYEVDLAKQSVSLRFDPEPRVVALDAPVAPLDAVATFDDEASEPAPTASGGSTTSAAGLPLELSTETGEVISRSMTIRGGRATFLVDPTKLGAPGRGALHVRFVGGDDTMPSEHAAPIERHTHVALTLVEAVEPASPEDGFPIEIATALTAGNAPPSYVIGGSVEARLGGVVVGAAALEAGRATIHATFVPPRAEKITALQVRYVPDAPWLQPAGDLAVAVPIRGPSPWRQAPLAIGALVVAAWLLIGRSARRLRLDRTIVMTRPPTHEGTAGVSVVHSSRSRTGKYGGRVVDAHDGTPVARARVSVQVPTFNTSEANVLASVFADDAGEFAFDLALAPPDAELVVEAPLHVDLRQKLPGGGVLEIAVVSRRRKLLERLVHWARRRGPPFDARPEPTPAQVRRAAENGQPAVAEWADAVEHAAFDDGVVDANVEAEVMALDPDRPEKRPR